jgi:uncharacterized alkaline shock family protein YloU
MAAEQASKQSAKQTAKGEETERVTVERTPSSTDEVGGTITLSESVVATITGLVAREIEGIHRLGRPRFISFGSESPTRGVAVEVGDLEAAIDLDAVIEYGANLQKTAETLRRRIAEEVGKMAGRRVVEVNINVVDVHLPEAEKQQPVEASSAARVR